MIVNYENGKCAYVSNMRDGDELQLPLFVTELVITNSSIRNLYVPRQIEIVICPGNNIEEIDIGWNLKQLYCSDNAIEEFHIQKKLLVLDIARNRLRKLTIDTANQFLSSLDIRDNQIEDFDVLLPDSMRWFSCSGNPGIRIKHLDFAFTDPVCFSEDLCDGDFWYVLDPNFKKYDETRLYWIWEKVNYGDTYIDVKVLPSDDNMFVIDEHRERSI